MAAHNWDSLLAGFTYLGAPTSLQQQCLRVRNTAYVPNKRFVCHTYLHRGSQSPSCVCCRRWSAPILDAVATCRAWIASNAAPNSIPVYTWLLQDVQPRLRRAYAAWPHMPRAAMVRSAANPGQTLRAPRKSGGVPHLAHVWELLLGYYVPELLAGGCARG
jgi:hypothetical protein